MNRLPFQIFIITLILGLFVIGTTELWSQTVLQILIALSALSCGVLFLKKGTVLHSSPGMTPLLLLLCWNFLQVLPLPLEFVKIVSPGAYDVYAPLHNVINEQSWVRCSVNLKGSVLQLIQLSSYVLFYVLVVQLFKDGNNLRRCVWFLVSGASVLALVALVQNYVSFELLFGLGQITELASPFGPWTNHNKYGGFMVMMFPFAIALFLFYQPVLNDKDSLRVRVAIFFSKPGLGRQLYLGVNIIVLAISIVLSLGRGSVSTLSLLLLLFILFLWGNQGKKGHWTHVAICSCVLLGIIWSGLDQIVVMGDRVFLWKDTWSIFKDYFLVGSGFGSFTDIYPAYRTVMGSEIYTHAHNDYLELLSSGGVVGFFLAVWFVIEVILKSWKKIRHRTDNYSVLVGIGALAAVCSVLSFNLTNYTMLNGADGLFFFLVCGILVSAGNTRFHLSTHGTLLPKSEKRWNKLILISGIFLLGISLGINGRALIAKAEYKSVEDIYLSKQFSKKNLLLVAEKFENAQKYDPFEAKYSFLLGDILEYYKQPGEAYGLYRRAFFKNPLNGVYLQRMALLLKVNEETQANTLMRIGNERVQSE